MPNTSKNIQNLWALNDARAHYKERGAIAKAYLKFATSLKRTNTDIIGNNWLSSIEVIFQMKKKINMLTPLKKLKQKFPLHSYHSKIVVSSTLFSFCDNVTFGICAKTQKGCLVDIPHILQ